MAFLSLAAGCTSRPVATSPDTGSHHNAQNLTPPTVVLVTSAGEVRVEVEVANDAQARAQGLMNRSSLEASKGMLFIFPSEMRQIFWMRNTYIPLDMIFIGSDMVIKGIVENAAPLTEDVRYIEEPSQYVLEVNAFFCKERGVRAGDRVEFINLP